MLRSAPHTPLSGLYQQALLGSGSSVALTTGTPANMTSLALPAGSYLVWCNIGFGLTAATVTAVEAGINTVSATMPGATAGAAIASESTVTATLTLSLGSAPVLVTLASAGTIFAVAQASFSAGTVGAFGGLFALRLDLP